MSNLSKNTSQNNVFTNNGRSNDHNFRRCIRFLRKLNKHINFRQTTLHNCY